MRILTADQRSVTLVAIVSLSVLFSTGSIGTASQNEADLAASVGAGGTGQPAVSGVPAATRSAVPVLDCPTGIAVNESDELFVANHWAPSTQCEGSGQILVFDDNGKQLTDRTITAGLGNPVALAFDKDDNLYVTAYDQHLVRVYNPAGTPLPAKFLKTDKRYNPTGVQVDSRGAVWVSNIWTKDIEFGEVEIFNKSGRVDKITEGLDYPFGIVFQEKTGNAWVANPGAITTDEVFAIFSANGRFLYTKSPFYFF